MKPDFVEPISPAPMILGVIDRDLRRVGLVVIRRIGREVTDCMVWELWVYGSVMDRDVDLELSVDHTVYDDVLGVRFKCWIGNNGIIE